MLSPGGVSSLHPGKDGQHRSLRERQREREKKSRSDDFLLDLFELERKPVCNGFKSAEGIDNLASGFSVFHFQVVLEVSRS